MLALFVKIQTRSDRNYQFQTICARLIKLSNCSSILAMFSLMQHVLHLKKFSLEFYHNNIFLYSSISTCAPSKEA